MPCLPGRADPDALKHRHAELEPLNMMSWLIRRASWLIGACESRDKLTPRKITRCGIQPHLPARRSCRGQSGSGREQVDRQDPRSPVVSV